ncbi:MAG: hypothetical protein H2174_03860 [Vampirovibrio sp.]|nr:hypothetical protein [Vampirovibrio sp.]
MLLHEVFPPEEKEPSAFPTLRDKTLRDKKTIKMGKVLAELFNAKNEENLTDLEALESFENKETIITAFNQALYELSILPKGKLNHQAIKEKMKPMLEAINAGTSTT